MIFVDKYMTGIYGIAKLLTEWVSWNIIDGLTLILLISRFNTILIDLINFKAFFRLSCSKKVEDPESKELRQANSIINSVAMVYIGGINFSLMT